jgi:hypothetical protein
VRGDDAGAALLRVYSWERGGFFKRAVIVMASSEMSSQIVFSQERFIAPVVVTPTFGHVLRVRGGRMPGEVFVLGKDGLAAIASIVFVGFRRFLRSIPSTCK